MAVDVPRIVFLVCLIVFIFVSPDTHTSSPSQRQELLTQIVDEKVALGVLNQSTNGAFRPSENLWLNLTGLRQVDNYAWDLLPQVQELASEKFRTAFEASSILQDGRNETSAINSSSKTLPENSAVPEDFLTFSKLLQNPPFFQNVTGIVRGQWSRSIVGSERTTNDLNLSVIAPNFYYGNKNHRRNITGSSGDLRIKLDEKKGEQLVIEAAIAREVSAEMLIKDETSSGDGWDIVMHGVHYPQLGSLLLSTTSERFAGIFALPHFSLSQRGFELAQDVLNRSIEASIKKQESSFDGIFNPWSSSPNSPSDPLFPTAQCEYICYLQQYPLDVRASSLEDVEKELRYPTGAPMTSVPGMKMSAIIFSPDCGFVLESKGPPHFSPREGMHLNGPKLESYLKLAGHSVLAFASLMASQIFLLKRQMHDTSTPSTRSRVSFFTIAMMALGDGFVCMSFMVAGMFIDALFLPLISTAFLSFICVSFFGMKFLMDVWTVQAPERQERAREQHRREQERRSAASATSSTGRNTNTTEEGILPLPATAHRRADNTTATPVILPPDQDIDAAEAEEGGNATTNQQPAAQTTTIGSAPRELGALYSKFYFLLLALLFLSLHATTWPTLLRSMYCNLLAFVYLSFWTPQIYRNVMRNCRKALRWEFVIGESVLRLAPLAYFYTVDSNVLFIETDSTAFYLLAGWVWIQVWALASQEVLGPRFFVPDGWAPPAYDYHPVLREGDGSDGESGSLLPLGFTESLNNDSQVNNDPTSPTATTSSSTTSAGAVGAAGTGAVSSSSSTSTKPRRPSTSRKRKDGKRIFDCAICTEDIEVTVISAGESRRYTDTETTNASPTSPSSSLIPTSTTTTSTTTAAAAAAASAATTALSTTLFSRRAYMVTPCRHIFHTPCLEGWMRYRLQCPICRESLPPL